MLLIGTKKRGEIVEISNNDVYKMGAYVRFDGQELKWFVPNVKMEKIKIEEERHVFN